VKQEHILQRLNPSILILPADFFPAGCIPSALTSRLFSTSLSEKRFPSPDLSLSLFCQLPVKTSGKVDVKESARQKVPLLKTATYMFRFDQITGCTNR